MEGETTTKPDIVDGDVQEISSNTFVLAIALCAFVMIVGAIGNPLIIYIVGRKYKHSTYRIFLLSLAYYDTIACFSLMPANIAQMWLWPHFKIPGFCRFVVTATHYVLAGSATTLLVIAIERYRMICRPLSKQIGTKMAKRICIIIAIPISCGFSFPGPILYGMSPVQQDRKAGDFNVTSDAHNLNNTTPTQYRCWMTKSFANTLYPTLYEAAQLVLIVTFTLAMSLLYLNIWRKIQQSTHLLEQSSGIHMISRMSVLPNIELEDTTSSIATDTTHNDISRYSIHTRTRERQGRKIARLSFTITLLFLFSYSPSFVLNMIRWLDPKDYTKISIPSRMVFEFFVKSYTINYMGNPFIYGAMDKLFRDNVKHLFRFGKCK